jgi:hypothetical protein
MSDDHVYVVTNTITGASATVEATTPYDAWSQCHLRVGGRDECTVALVPDGPALDPEQEDTIPPPPDTVADTEPPEEVSIDYYLTRAVNRANVLLAEFRDAVQLVVNLTSEVNNQAAAAQAEALRRAGHPHEAVEVADYGVRP